MGTIRIQARRSVNWYVGLFLLIFSSLLIVGGALQYQSDVCNVGFIALLLGASIWRVEFRDSALITLMYGLMICIGVVAVLAI